MIDPFWDFSVKLYESPGAAAECLQLQDDYGVDVNVLLFCAYTAVIVGTRLTEQNLADIERHVAEIRTGVIAPLRDCRRAMKAAAMSLTNGDGERAQYLRSQVKELELVAERLEQERLVGWLNAGVRVDCRSGTMELEGNLRRLLARHIRHGRTAPYPVNLAKAAQELVK